MSSRAPTSGPLREARSCYDHLAGRLGTALASAALHRGWVVEDGDQWRLAADATAAVSRSLGIDVSLDAGSRRAAVRRCLDWTEHRPHLAGAFGAALLGSMLDAGWLTRVGGGRALTVTSQGAQGLRKSGVHGIVVDESGCEVDGLCYSGAVLVTVAAADDWSALVDRAAAEGWTGIEALAAFTGTVGDAVVQNVSAFGEQVADVVWSVRTRDRTDRAQRTFAMADCDFGPGGSRFAVGRSGHRYDVLDVAFLFRAGTVTGPLQDDCLAGLLGADLGDRVALPLVRDAVLAAAR